MRRLKFREVKILVQGHIANRSAGLHLRFSVFKCYALSTQTFCSISACDIALLLFAALNKDCVYSGVTCCLGGEPSSSQITAIKKNPLCQYNCLCSFFGDPEILFPAIIQRPPHPCHSSSFNASSAFHYRQFVVRGEVS